jgi:hypothetical protein
MSVAVMVSCESDIWKDHYSVHSDGNESVASLGKTIAAIPEASRFVEALKSTYMFLGDSLSTLTYWDFLNDNQFLTVWLPDDASISEAEWNEYTKEIDDPTKNHKKVGTEFILNHIARFSHPVGTETKERVKMMSNKTYRSVGGSFDGVGYKENNERCTNGLLHRLSGRIQYKPNLYDYLTGAYKTKSARGLDYDYTVTHGELGKWLAKYTREELDETRSIQGDPDENGEITYIDKVIIRSNAVLQKYGYIDAEDSDYIVVLPIASVWDSAYDAISQYFAYDTAVIGHDSLCAYWTNASMITDAIFNRNQKGLRDYATSTQFRWAERMTEKYPYHVFSKPYEAGGLFADSTLASVYGVIDSINCSNGVIYVRNNWPYSDSVFRRTIRIEAEDELQSGENWQLRPKSARYMLPDSTIKWARVMEISHDATSWTATYDIKNTLKGKYRVKLVFFRNVEDDQTSKVSFVLEYFTSGGTQKLYSGKTGSTTVNYEVGKKELYPDTIVVGASTKTPSNPSKSFEMPYGNYESGSAKLRLTVKSAKGSDLTKKVWLDCIILEPVFE